MLLSDLFNISRTVRRDKARQQDLLPVASSSTSAPARLCNICYANPATYNCPRCNIPFCSTICFRGREHQECSNAFSASAVSLVEQSSEVRADEDDRSNVVEMLGRLERNEKEALQMQHDIEDDNDDDDEDEDDDAVKLRADITADQVEGASTEALLTMLTPKERQKFLEAIKDPQSAALLMERLDRKSERRARLEASPSPQGVLITSQSDTDTHQPKVVKEWQSLLWFDTSKSSFDFSHTSPKHISSFVASFEKALSAERSRSKTQGPSPSVNLVYNLCAILMAYAYALRHLDLTSLSVRSVTSDSAHKNISEEIAVVPATGQDDEDDDEPPPLEPDSPTSFTPDSASLLSAAKAASTSTSDSQVQQDLARSEQAFDQLNRLVPFLFTQPTSSTTATAGGRNDHSKLLLASLDDASMWLLSRLSLDSEVGPGGADAISLQLLQDLAKLLAHERLVPTFAQGQEVEPRFWLASMLASLSPQQAFTAAQMPLLLNAVVDIYFLLEHLSTSTSSPSSAPMSISIQPKSIKLAQRKLCFYLGSVVNALQQSATRLQLDSELQQHIQRLRHQIDAANQADKVAAAVNLFSNGSAQQSTNSSIEAAI
ncbi:conserved hypothetical protein [Sporisorium reilianum SRZ2]|uniref:HIT-type domain-containing protein n=1 Tax=Sporisorium reilianum (strain SRZ2) TaxID=999809 RepID=E6ZP37_SPORE|nr:conserved hypothetical protein [Sporisorium reilianum SRZ2]